MTLPVEAGQRLSPQDAYARALRGEHCRVLVDGRATALDVARWLAEPSISDLEMLGACRGRTIDLGCGPGRLSAGLARVGVPSLGVDLEPEAVRLAQRRGATALVRDLFKPMPGEGRWDTALLADGNLGIGGDPAVLLRRVSRLLAPGGRLVAEVPPPGTPGCRYDVRLEIDGEVSTAFPWAVVPLGQLVALAASVDLHLLHVQAHRGRWFATAETSRP